MAGQTISAEAALPLFRQRCSELQDENLLLKARIAELEEALRRAQDTAPPVGDEQPSATSFLAGEPV